MGGFRIRDSIPGFTIWDSTSFPSVNANKQEWKEVCMRGVIVEGIENQL